MYSEEIPSGIHWQRILWGPRPEFGSLRM